MVDLSQKNRLSIRALQVYGQVAKESGSTVEGVADAVFKLGVNIEGGGEKITRALSGSAYSYEHIGNLKPEQQFAEIAAKLQAVDWPGTQSPRRGSLRQVLGDRRAGRRRGLDSSRRRP